MANVIQVTTIPTSNFVTPSSRYADSTVIYYSENNFITFETYKRPEIEVGADDMYMILPASSQYRPDLVSNQVYGTVEYWWKIMEVNAIFDIIDFKTGINLRLPKNIFN